MTKSLHSVIRGCVLTLKTSKILKQNNLLKITAIEVLWVTTGMQNNGIQYRTQT